LVWATSLAIEKPSFAQGPFSANGVIVSTYHNDNARTGRNLQENILTPASVGSGKFGKIRSLAVDGDVYAQPLYLSNLIVAGKSRNVVFVATQHDSVYAFDGDDGTQLWKVSFLIGPGVSSLNAVADLHQSDIKPEVGITGTPVIRVDKMDASKNTLYVVAKTKTVAVGTTTFEQRLHALDVTDGTERPNSPVLIAGQVNGSGTGWDTPPMPPTNIDNDGAGHVVFNPLRQNQRAGLVLSKGVIYITWASHSDIPPYHGWVMGYDADTLQQVAVFNAAPNGGRVGIWQSAAAPAADAAGNLYFTTGNGTFEPTLNAAGFPNRADFGDSVLKLAPDASTPSAPNSNGWGLKVVDYFTPFDQFKLGGPDHDSDLGSSGVVLLDDQPSGPAHLLAVSGKEGVIYLIDRDKMGKFDPAKDNVVARLPAIPGNASLIGDAFSTATYFGSSLFFVGAPLRDSTGAPIGSPAGPNPLREFTLAGGKLTPAKSTSVLFGWKTCTPTVSASGTTNGIVWLVQAEEFRPLVPSILHAFDATDLGKELYSSDVAVTPAGAKRDQPGIGMKFCVPTVANGKVFLGSVGEVTVYGLLGP
jgi:outer membrane protein assembly factor BamB